MKKIINHEIYGEICYEESEWTGKKTIIINGVTLEKESKKTYLYKKDDKTIYVDVVGSALTGVKLKLEGKEIEITESSKWYQYMLAIIPAVFIIVWGNVPQLVKIFPIVGGALGGVLAGGLCAGGLILSSKVKEWYLKVLIQLGMGIGAFYACYLAALAILGFM